MNLNSTIDRKIVKYIMNIEKNAVEKADVVIVASREDKDEMARSYGKDPSMIFIIPNGVNSNFPEVTDADKETAKRELGLAGKKVVLFTGWAYPPNYQAVEEILKISDEMNREDVHFIVAGRAGDPYRSINKKNVRLTGYVDDISIYFKAADIAINPMVCGGGTNVKMLEYFQWGIPVITTKTGARGLDIKDGEHAIISSREDFPQNIRSLLNHDAMRSGLRGNARKLIEEKYDWASIALGQIALYEQLTGKK